VQTEACARRGAGPRAPAGGEVPPRLAARWMERRMEAVIARQPAVGEAVAAGLAAAGLDEGLLSLCLPHSRLYGESL
jgi:hypothetical protein